MPSATQITLALAVAVGLTAAVVAFRPRTSAPPSPPDPAIAASARAAETASARKNLIDAAQSAVKKSLRDPESARFRGGAIEPGMSGATSVQVACGAVNAKNGFGGYTGEETWYVVIYPGGEGRICLKLAECDFMKPDLIRPAIICASQLPG